MLSRKKIILGFILATVGFGAYFSSCRWDKTVTGDTGYPNDIAKIIITKCSITGCHTPADKFAAGGLALDSWDDLFKGGNGGSVVIPYRADQSWLCYFVNTFDDLGIQLHPTMPQNQAPLSRDEVQTIYDWVNAGAPNKHGDIAFSGADRKKFYVTDQGCDMITVFDEETQLAMRYINVGGDSNNIESPHNIKLSPDWKYWYVIFANGSVLQKYDAATDCFVSQMPLGEGSYNTMLLTPDGSHAWIVDWSSAGAIHYVDLDHMTQLVYEVMPFHHGITATQNFDTLYVTGEGGNYITKIDVTDPTDPQSVNVSLQPDTAWRDDLTSIRPHEVKFSPDYTKYYVTCYNSSQLRIMNTANDSLLKIIPIGANPAELSFSLKHPYLFVSCIEEACGTHCVGSVYVVNYQTDEVIKEFHEGFYQPHGIAVDDFNGLVYILNRNLDTDGPPPHHTSTCGGRNGFIRIIDMNTLTMMPDYKAEVSVDPYQVAVRNFMEQH